MFDREYFSTDTQLAIDPADFQLMPPNILALRYDAPNDVYTLDRWTKNGAEFVRWQSSPGVLQCYNHMNQNFWSAGTMLLDISPRCDNYHDQTPAAPSVDIEDIREFYPERILAYQKEEIFLGEYFNLADLIGQSASVTSLKTTQLTYLDYAFTLDRLRNKQGGSHDVRLDQHTGAMVTGKFFTALRQNERRRSPLYRKVPPSASAVLLLGSGAVVWLFLHRKIRAPAAVDKS